MPCGCKLHLTQGPGYILKVERPEKGENEPNGRRQEPVSLYRQVLALLSLALNQIPSHSEAGRRMLWLVGVVQENGQGC